MNTLRGDRGHPENARDESSMPLHTMSRFSNDGTLDSPTGDAREDGEQDVDPLLPSEGGTLGKVKAEIEHELADSGGDSAYDRKFWTAIMIILVFSTIY